MSTTTSPSSLLLASMEEAIVFASKEDGKTRLIEKINKA
jgi:arginine/lysine/ornithine decarboxylase